jgi:hypothetical protein
VANCPAFTPCGGNLIGIWQIQSSCAPELDSSLSAALGFPACADAIHLLSANQLGTFTLGSDGSYSEQSTLDMDMQTALSLACANAVTATTMTAADMPAFCSNYESGMRASPEVTEVSCAVSGEQCVCTTVVHYEFADSGTYTVSGTTLTTDRGATLSYCVQNDLLTMRETTDTLGDTYRTFQRMLL